MPPPPTKWVDPRPNRPIVLHSADVFVDKNALCYVTDFSAGLYIVEYKGVSGVARLRSGVARRGAMRRPESATRT